MVRIIWPALKLPLLGLTTERLFDLRPVILTYLRTTQRENLGETIILQYTEANFDLVNTKVVYSCDCCRLYCHNGKQLKHAIMRKMKKSYRYLFFRKRFKTEKTRVLKPSIK